MDPPLLICHQDKRAWPCELARDWSVVVDRLKGRVAAPYTFRTEKPGHSCSEWLKLDADGTVTIRSGYGTDGCSMVPDFPNALPGCVLHDALRQATTLDPDLPLDPGRGGCDLPRSDGGLWLQLAGALAVLPRCGRPDGLALLLV
jgi:hypothetical protein